MMTCSSLLSWNREVILIDADDIIFVVILCSHLFVIFGVDLTKSRIDFAKMEKGPWET